MQNNSTWAPSQPSRTNWPPESFGVLPSVAVALGAVAIVIAVTLAYLLVAMTLGGLDPRHPDAIAPVQVLLTQVIAYVPLAAYLLVVIPRVAHMSLAQLGLRMPTMGQLATGAIGTVAMWIAVIAASAAIEALTHRHDTEAAIALLKSIRTPFEKASFILIAVALAPMVEELAFRVFVFNALWRRMPLPAAAVTSGVLFGLVHALGASKSQLLTIGVPLAFGGIVLALVYARTNSYWSCVTTHALFNTVTVVQFFVFGITS